MYNNLVFSIVWQPTLYEATNHSGKDVPLDSSLLATTLW